MSDIGEEEEVYFEDTFQGKMLWLIRMVPFETGLKMEPCTRPAHELLVYEYISKLLALRLRQNKLGVYHAQLIEFDEVVDLQAVIPKKFANEFSEFVNFTGGRYLWMPQRHSEGFGFHSNTCTWLYPHETAPAIFTKDMPRTMSWLYGIQDRMPETFKESDLVFPEMDEENSKYAVPEEFKNLSPMRRKLRSGIGFSRRIA